MGSGKGQCRTRCHLQLLARQDRDDDSSLRVVTEAQFIFLCRQRLVYVCAQHSQICVSAQAGAGVPVCMVVSREVSAFYVQAGVHGQLCTL